MCLEIDYMNFENLTLFFIESFWKIAEFCTIMLNTFCKGNKVGQRKLRPFLILNKHLYFLVDMKCITNDFFLNCWFNVDSTQYRRYTCQV